MLNIYIRMKFDCDLYANYNRLKVTTTTTTMVNLK